MSTEPAPRSAVGQGDGSFDLAAPPGRNSGGFLRLVVGAAASAQVGWTRGLRCDRLPCRLQRESDRDGGPQDQLGSSRDPTARPVGAEPRGLQLEQQDGGGMSPP
ncbi:hypothetical protein ANO14919_023250 [Xylariales sp. No.14919]|nr:hypothetical protein ANO14919_023250 [Xylariales sp. No.14919]